MPTENPSPHTIFLDIPNPLFTSLRFLLESVARQKGQGLPPHAVLLNTDGVHASLENALRVAIVDTLPALKTQLLQIVILPPNHALFENVCAALTSLEKEITAVGAEVHLAQLDYAHAESRWEAISLQISAVYDQVPDNVTEWKTLLGIPLTDESSPLLTS